jgi:hypothetical protein
MHQDPGRTVRKSQIRNPEPRHTARPSGFALRAACRFMRTANDRHLIFPRHRGQQALHARCGNTGSRFSRHGRSSGSCKKKCRQPANAPAADSTLHSALAARCAAARRWRLGTALTLSDAPNRWFCLVVHGCFRNIHRLHSAGSRCNTLACLTPPTQSEFQLEVERCR